LRGIHSVTVAISAQTEGDTGYDYNEITSYEEEYDDDTGERSMRRLVKKRHADNECQKSTCRFVLCFQFCSNFVGKPNSIEKRNPPKR
jgi:hypothetical protein